MPKLADYSPHCAGSLTTPLAAVQVPALQFSDSHSHGVVQLRPPAFAGAHSPLSQYAPRPHSPLSTSHVSPIAVAVAQLALSVSAPLQYRPLAQICSEPQLSSASRSTISSHWPVSSPQC